MLTGLHQESSLSFRIRLRGGSSGMSFAAFEHAEMGIAAGGLIKQAIQEDPYDPETWDYDTISSMNVQILSSGMFERITGYEAPPSPVNEATYRRYGLHFFDFPEEAQSTVAGQFGKLKSLKQLRLIWHGF